MEKTQQQKRTKRSKNIVKSDSEKREMLLQLITGLIDANNTDPNLIKEQKT
jgi:hypothetical protein